MKVQFLGVTGSIQSARSANVSLLVSHSDTKVLIDVSGSPVQALCLCNVDPLGLTHLFLTHSHVDHLYGLPSLVHQLWLLGRTDELLILGNGETLKRARALCAVFSLEEKKGMFPLIWTALDEMEQAISCTSMELQLFPVNHGIPTLGCLFLSEQGSIAYLADTAPMESYPRILHSPSLLIHEAGGMDSGRDLLNSKGHCSALQAGRAGASLQAGRLFLCHLPENQELYADMLREARSLFPQTSIPEVFRSYEIERGKVL
ncbi:MAG: MBL fold metallo-hydrolase [Sphaerochaeta sp.]|nr:MBL fold metallo-hydrolase [Sphaerochaeta sp.]